ncbi:MAG: hypothetical protein QM756_34465 [Polyangiaceae bacterium]
MNTQALIDAVVQRTTVFIAQLATAGGVRTPLSKVADQVFLDLSKELEAQGVRKKVIADMFGMALRTYHRRVRELRSSRTEGERTLWEVVLAFLREREPVSARDVQRRFQHDDPEILIGVLNDLVGSGLAYRAGSGESTVYRVADQADFAQLDEEHRAQANEYLVWLAVYRHQPVGAARVAELSRLSTTACEAALSSLVREGRVSRAERNGQPEYTSPRLEVPFGASSGWETAVLDHFQAMLTALGMKLTQAPARARATDVVGGSTWSLELWDGHPLEQEAVATLTRIREQVENLRQRIDSHRATTEQATGEQATAKKRVVCYAGQYVVYEDATPVSEADTHDEEQQ